MSGERMLIAQITDLHLGFDQGNPDEFNRQRLDRAVAALAAMEPRPDLLLVTGDLAEEGDDEISYRRLKAILADLPFPSFMAMGNHDSRAPFRLVFPDAPGEDGFIQYVIDRGPLRIVVLDTLEEGRHGGAFCERREAWLRARLAEEPQRPTLIVLHHPPIETGLSWMTENPDAAWTHRLRRVIEAHSNIVAMIAGHLHRAVITKWAGTTLAVCPSTAPQVALDLQPIDPDLPDGRPMIVADHPYYALHLWNGRELVTHIDSAEDHNVLASYGPALQPLVRMLVEEKKRPA
jgi:3',5'-cyclic AMP phosphodiesterase CpdA